MKCEALGAQEPECTYCVHEDSEHRTTKQFTVAITFSALPLPFNGTTHRTLNEIALREYEENQNRK
jgi:hypothetical protein